MTRRLIASLACAALALGLVACGGGGGGGGGAKGGSTHALGEQAVVQHTQIVGGGGAAPRTTLAITVLKVRKGTQEELRQGGYTVDAKSRSATPYYVDVRYANKGAQAIKRNLDVSLEDQDGNLITSTVIFNYGGRPFGKCPKIDTGNLAPGKSYKSCTLFLVPKGRNPSKVSFLPYDPKHATEFVYWNVT